MINGNRAYKPKLKPKLKPETGMDARLHVETAEAPTIEELIQFLRRMCIEGRESSAAASLSSAKPHPVMDDSQIPPMTQDPNRSRSLAWGSNFVDSRYSGRESAAAERTRDLIEIDSIGDYTDNTCSDSASEYSDGGSTAEGEWTSGHTGHYPHTTLQEIPASDHQRLGPKPITMSLDSTIDIILSLYWQRPPSLNNPFHHQAVQPMASRSLETPGTTKKHSAKEEKPLSGQQDQNSLPLQPGDPQQDHSPNRMGPTQPYTYDTRSDVGEGPPSPSIKSILLCSPMKSFREGRESLLTNSFQGFKEGIRAVVPSQGTDAAAAIPDRTNAEPVVEEKDRWRSSMPPKARWRRKSCQDKQDTLHSIIRKPGSQEAPVQKTSDFRTTAAQVNGRWSYDRAVKQVRKVEEGADAFKTITGNRGRATTKKMVKTYGAEKSVDDWRNWGAEIQAKNWNAHRKREGTQRKRQARFPNGRRLGRRDHIRKLLSIKLPKSKGKSFSPVNE